MTRGSVAKEAIEAARVEFLRQYREWERHRRADDADDASDADDAGDTTEEEEASPNIQVEIARGVTQRMKDRIPTEWLVGLAIELLPDGVLVLLAVETEEHHQVVASVGGVLTPYAEDYYLLSYYPWADHFDYNGHEHHPDGVLLQRVDAPPAPLSPILVAEVEVKHRSIPQLIQIATEYLQRESIGTVVGFKVFPGYERVYRRQTPRLRKPALAVVFERVPGQAAAPFAIQIVAEVSFGSAPIRMDVRRKLSALPTRTRAADATNPRVIPPSPYEQLMIASENVQPSFGRMVPHLLVVPVVSGRDVLGADPLPDVVFDLRRIFQSALHGWQEDGYEDD